MNHKKILRSVLYIIITILLFALTFSKSIYNNSLAQVEIFVPSYGKLVEETFAYGNADYYEIKNEYSKYDGLAEKMNLKKGDYIKKGDLILVLKNETEEEIEDDEEEEDFSLEIGLLGIEREKIDNKIIELEQKKLKYEGLKLNLEKPILELKNDYSSDKSHLEKKVEDASNEYEKYEKLYNNGVISQNELKEAENALYDSKFELQKLLEDIEKEKTEVENDFSVLEKEYEEKISEYDSTIEEVDYEIKNLDLDKETLDLEEADYKKEKPKPEVKRKKDTFEIYAEHSGVITEIFLENGQYISKGQQLMSIGIGNMFKLDCIFEEDDFDFIDIGDECTIERKEATFEGTVDEIKSDSVENLVTISMESEENIKGQRFKVNFEKEMYDNAFLIPNSAVFEDADGFYIYRISQRAGSFGTEYYVAKKRIRINGKNEQFSSIESGIENNEPCVLRMSKEISQGASVRVVNEVDLIVAK